MLLMFYDFYYFLCNLFYTIFFLNFIPVDPAKIDLAPYSLMTVVLSGSFFSKVVIL